MTGERDDYDVFLDTWKPGEGLVHASLPQNQFDPLIQKRLSEDSTGTGPVARTVFAQGYKTMADEESIARASSFFDGRQALWAEELKDLAMSNGVPEEKLEAFVSSFAQLWIDGKKRRQDSPEMLAIRASIALFDRVTFPNHAGRFVIEVVDPMVPPLFTPDEVQAIFDANAGMIEAFLPDYVDHLGHEGPVSLGNLYIRRGVYMPAAGTEVRNELHYLSSYSLALGPVEQFAQTWTPQTQERGTPTIFSAPLTAIQNRVVAFTPFIANMDLRQLEFVIAPPVERITLIDDGLHGNIQEFRFL